MNAITKGYEDVPMSRRRAQLLAEYADKLAEMLENAPDDQDLAEWVQSKIDRAAAAIQSAYHYLDQEEEEDELEKAAGHKYTHRKRVGTDKRGRARYRYYYQEHHGGGITSAKFEAGSSFKLTYRGRRGHFHIQSVEGDMVTITHDGRPGMKPVSIHRDELRALLKKQHGKALEAHVEKRRREVEALDRDRSRKRSGLGLALHRLRQAADKAGISLPEQYQRKPKKTRAPAQEPREDNFETMPESASSIKERYDRLQEKTDTLEAKIESLEDAIENPPPFIPSDDINTGFYEWQEAKRKRESKLKAEIETLKAQYSAQDEELRTLSLDLHNAQQRERAQKRAQRAPAQETPREVEPPTPRNELTETAQQIIEEANQDHDERHDEHQEITKFELGEHTHTKTGQKLYTAKQKERTDRDEYFRRVEIAKKHKGRYERRYVKGFVFKTAEDARAFALEVEGAAQAPEASAETVTPHEEHPGADNFETMPDTEARDDLERYREVRAKTSKQVKQALRSLKTGAQTDKLTATGRRARASINADKKTIEITQKILDEAYNEMERPLPSDINQRTPQQDNFAKLRGALNSFKSSQALTRGSWADDHESLKKKRIKARVEITTALKELNQVTGSQEFDRVMEERKRRREEYPNTPRPVKREAEETGTKREQALDAIKEIRIYDQERLEGRTIREGESQFGRSGQDYRLVNRLRDIIQATSQGDATLERLSQEFIDAGSQNNERFGVNTKRVQVLRNIEDHLNKIEDTPQPTRTAHTIVLDRLIQAKRSGDEAQEAQVNEQLRPQLLSLLEKLEQGTLDDGERQALLSRYQELETLTSGAGKELAQEIVSRLRGADNFETMPDEHKEFIQNKTREFSRELMQGLIYEGTKRGKIKSLQRQVTGSMQSALVKLALSGLRGKEVTNSNVKWFIASKISGERAEETQGRLSALLSAGDTIEDKQDTLYKQALIEAADHIDEIAQGLATDDEDFTEAEHRAIKQRTDYLRALSAEIEIKDTQPTPDPSPARAQLAETVREISEPASSAAVRSTPKPSEATLRGSGELSGADRANLQDRAQFLSRMPEDTTKTGRRSKRQKSRDQELLLIHRRLYEDASARLGPTAPRLADFSQFVKLQGIDLPDRAQTRADFRTGIMSSIEELRSATTAQPVSGKETAPPKKLSPQIKRDVNKISREISEDHDLLQNILKNHPDREYEITASLRRLQTRIQGAVSDIEKIQGYSIGRRLERTRPQLTREITELYNRGQDKEALARIVGSVKEAITPEATDTGNTAKARREAKKLISRLEAYSEMLSSTVQKSLSAPKLTKMITYRAQLLQTIERIA